MSNALIKQSPIYINKSHVRERFHCSEDDLNDFIKTSAHQNHKNNISKTYVVLNNEYDKNVIAFYTLAYYNIELKDLKNKMPSDISRGIKEKIPCVLLAMLARDDSVKGEGYGKFLLTEAIIKTYKASKIAGIKGLFLNAINPTVAEKFYDKMEFLIKIDEKSRLYYIPINTINNIVETMGIKLE